MKEYKLQLLTLAVIAVIALSISLTASAPLLSAAPSTNPPSGNVTPNFSGLNVTGNGVFGGTLRANGLLSALGGLTVVGNMSLIGDTSFLSNYNIFFGDIETYGDISSYGDIGSFYTKTMSTSITSSGAHETPQVSCYSGDWVTGCNAILYSDSSSDKLYGTMTEGDRTCKAIAGNNGGSSDTITLYARCFDPNGARSGTY